MSRRLLKFKNKKLEKKKKAHHEQNKGVLFMKSGVNNAQTKRPLFPSSEQDSPQGRGWAPTCLGGLLSVASPAGCVRRVRRDPPRWRERNKASRNKTLLTSENTRQTHRSENQMLTSERLWSIFHLEGQHAWMACRNVFFRAFWRYLLAILEK